MQASVVIIDSRSDQHPDWVQTCIESIMNQTVEVELIVIDNIGRKRTIGQCWNEGVKQATGEWVFFVGDDCWIARDCVQVMLNHTNTKSVNVTTYMTVFEDETGFRQLLSRQCTGMFKRDYLLEHPFNEQLTKGIDREYLEELVKRGQTVQVIDYYFGHYDRKHSDYSCAGDITFATEMPDIYFLCGGGRSFIDPIAKRFEKDNSIFIGSKFDSRIAAGTKVIWSEWANRNATEVANFKCDAKKILRLHAYEAFTSMINYIKFDRFDTVIFVAQHIKDYVESKIGVLSNAIVLPNAIDTDRFYLSEHAPNNKIAFAGQISRKKGIGLLMFLAYQNPKYEFHIAGKYSEEDVQDWVERAKPSNLHIHPHQYDLPDFYKDKTYVINTSLREGCPVAFLEGMSMGLMPITFDWTGSENVVPKKYIFRTVGGLRKILGREYEPKKYRQMVVEKYDKKIIYEKIDNIISIDNKLLEVKNENVAV